LAYVLFVGTATVKDLRDMVAHQRDVAPTTLRILVKGISHPVTMHVHFLQVNVGKYQAGAITAHFELL